MKLGNVRGAVVSVTAIHGMHEGTEYSTTLLADPDGELRVNRTPHGLTVELVSRQPSELDELQESEGGGPCAGR